MLHELKKLIIQKLYYSHVQIEENVNLEGKSDTKTLRKN